LCPTNEATFSREIKALLSGHKCMNGTSKYRGLPAVVLFGMVYLVVGIAFPNPPASSRWQFWWRLAAWLICAFAFALHIGLEHFRFKNALRRTALHAALAVAFGAFALAAAANIHALTAGTGNQRSLALALVIWPITAGLPAFAVAWGAAAVLARLRPNDNPLRN
jgi:hypothetical protein